MGARARSCRSATRTTASPSTGTSLEAVAECAALFAEPTVSTATSPGVPAPISSLLGALLHDVGKGQPGDHSAVGAEAAGQSVRASASADGDVETLVWLVRNHLLLAETATRRDLSEEVTVDSLRARRRGRRAARPALRAHGRGLSRDGSGGVDVDEGRTRA